MIPLCSGAIVLEVVDGAAVELAAAELAAAVFS
jgi:hypothetical protein